MAATNKSINEPEIASYEEIPEADPVEQLDVVTVKREDTRGILAVSFVIGFFIIILAGMVIGALNEGDKVSSVRDVIIAISGILSGPLGFVIGYYFRSREQGD